jgi:hypothetical protein
MSGSQTLWSLAMLLVSILTVVIAVQFNGYSAVVFWVIMMLTLLILRPE